MVHFTIRGRGEDGRRGRQGATEHWDRWWVVQYKASSALLFASRREGVEEWMFNTKRWETSHLAHNERKGKDKKKSDKEGDKSNTQHNQHENGILYIPK